MSTVMEAVASTELDDAIFPQPPQDVVVQEADADSAVCLDQETSHQVANYLTFYSKFILPNWNRKQIEFTAWTICT